VLNPIASREVTDAACHDTTTTTGIDIHETISVTHQTEADAGYVITGGLALAHDPETGAFNGSYHRMRVLGKDRTCITVQAGRHLLGDRAQVPQAGQNRVPLTANVGAGPRTTTRGRWPRQSSCSGAASTRRSSPPRRTRTRTA
jgi:UbiD family decarboxylase